MKPDSPDQPETSPGAQSNGAQSNGAQSNGAKSDGDMESDATLGSDGEPAEGRTNPYTQPPTDFESLAGSEDPGLVREFVDFLQDNKKWWLAPILVVTLILVGLVFLSASPAAPFIYTLF